MTVLERVSSLVTDARGPIVEVLNLGQIDDESRRKLRGVNRALTELTAALTVQPETDDDDEGSFYRTWSDHVGSMWAVYGRLPHYAKAALEEARLVWLDELDRMSDTELLAMPGVGTKTLECVRSVLRVYYWRGEPAESEVLWRSVLAQLERSLGSIERWGERGGERVRGGITLAECVLSDSGRVLGDPAAVRMVP